MNGKRIGLSGVFVLSAMLVFAFLAAAQVWNPQGPLARGAHSAVLDTVNDRMIVFGGGTSAPDAPPAAHFNDVWFLDGATRFPRLRWLNAEPTGTPPSTRASHSAIYDPASNGMVVFGGQAGFAAPCFNDLWVLQNANGQNADGQNANGNGMDGRPAWVQLSPLGGPPSPRYQHRASYHQSTNTMIVFGGDDCFGTNFNDVWILTNANGATGTPTWRQLFPAGTLPRGRLGFGEVYDPATNRMIIFGGVTGNFLGSTFLNDVWVLTNADGTGGIPTWIQLSPVGSPPCARQYVSAVYESTNNRMTIFGGFCTQPMGDAWVLVNANGLGGTPTWTQLVPGGTLPLGRFSHTAVYNPDTNLMTIFGGAVTSSGLSTTTVSVLTKANGLP